MSDASNLPEVLNRQQALRDRHQRYNEHVAAVFPHIEWVSVDAVGSHVEIILWRRGSDTARRDLAISLKDCGTGIGRCSQCCT